MTIRQIMQRTDLLKPNPYPAQNKILWISDLECMIQKQIFLSDDDDIVTYDETTSPDTDVLLGDSEIALYTAYLVAMIDLFNGDSERYNLSINLFNLYFGQTMRRYAARHYDTAEVTQ